MTSTARAGVGWGLAAAAALVLAAAAAGAAPADSISPDRFAVDASGHALEIPIESSRPLDRADASVERIVVVVHGSSRNADDYRRRVEDAVALRPGETERTLVVAPQFLEQDDVAHWSLAPTTLYWSSGWRSGSLSRDDAGHPRPARISSYAVIDQLLDALVDPALFPNLGAVVLAGHSAGGQFVHRYAAGTDAVERHAGVAFRFVVANPSSYLYLSPERPVAGAPGAFAPPSASERAACPGYDDYKYGLEDLYSYMAAGGAAGIVARYASREVRYLLGAEDQGSEGLDTGCEAGLTGPHRLARGEAYFGFLGHFYGPSIGDRHRLAVVAGVGHSSSQMFRSDAGVEALLPAPQSPPQPGPGPPAPPPPEPPPPEPLGQPGQPYVLR